MKNSLIISAALLIFPTVALADGDPARGKALTGACTACHQEDGNGRDNGAGADSWPRLAGINADYLATQLAAYKKGERRAASMKTFAMMLDEGKAADIAAYYAALPPPAAANSTTADAAQLARGKQLAEVGDPAKNLKPCRECHGADNRGDGKIPAITAQPAPYLRAQITAWKQGDRANDSTDPKGMFQTARQLDDADSAAVAAWLSTQAP
ncbi:c-type cytochrome [uncultured Cardiobacterium sp.]|uniref:c-type cytochrome n=1 Tax=uncultured Cardiobacterium sp. TaxID=417619 RepID=UPI00263035E0|nr:c-type cytochrome [uncultured Cardiobacterium sp.]